MIRLRVAFDPLPVARWGALFHIFALEQPEVRLEWLRAAFPRRDRSPLEGADVGLFLEPPDDPDLQTLTVGVSRMVVVMAAGHRLARHHELRVADLLDEPFPDGEDLHPGWKAFWTLDEQRGAPPPPSNAEVSNVEEALAVVASGRAITTFAESLFDGLSHPGVIALPLIGAPAVTTRLVWRLYEPSRAVHALVDIARDMFGPDRADRVGR
jgi:DNA-binding transcriptional LysR family regulator